MDNVCDEYFLLSYLKESELEEKYREEGYTHMIVNGYEVRWPRFENFISAYRAGHVEYFTPGGPEENWNLIPTKDVKF